VQLLCQDRAVGPAGDHTQELATGSRDLHAEQERARRREGGAILIRTFKAPSSASPRSSEITSNMANLCF